MFEPVIDESDDAVLMVAAENALVNLREFIPNGVPSIEKSTVAYSWVTIFLIPMTLRQAMSRRSSPKLFGKRFDSSASWITRFTAASRTIQSSSNRSCRDPPTFDPSQAMSAN
jgi:hypothetical protein